MLLLLRALAQDYCFASPCPSVRVAPVAIDISATTGIDPEAPALASPTGGAAVALPNDISPTGGAAVALPNDLSAAVESPVRVPVIGAMDAAASETPIETTGSTAPVESPVRPVEDGGLLYNQAAAAASVLDASSSSRGQQAAYTSVSAASAVAAIGLVAVGAVLLRLYVRAVKQQPQQARRVSAAAAV